MAPKKSSGSALLPANPHSGNLEAVSKWLLQLKLKVSAVKSDRAAKALRDVEQAAAALDTCLEPLETGHPALQLAVSQASLAEARRVQEQCRQLSQDTARFMLVVGSSQYISHAAMWPLLRPALRLLLWLLPEHVPVAEPQAQPVSTGSQLPEHGTPPVAQTAGTSKQGKHKKKADPIADVNWRQGLGPAFVQDVATPLVANALLPTFICRVSGIQGFRDLQPTAEDVRLVEECLVLMTLANRLYTLACEMEFDRSTASAKRPAPAETLASYYLPQLAAQRPALLVFLDIITFWLTACGIKSKRDGDTLDAQRMIDNYDQIYGTDEAVYLRFARCFKPSQQMANAVGLYKDPVVIWHQLTSFFVTQSLRDKLTSTKPLVTCYATYPLHATMLVTMLPSSFTKEEFPRPELADRLPHIVEFHLRGLTLTLRIPLGFQPQSEALPKLNTAVPAVIVAAELIWRCMFLPGPGDDLDTTLRNLRFVSEDYRGQASRAPLLPLQEDCDRALKRWLEKVQQYKARQQGVERSALEPSSSTREAWLRAAVAASEALHFLLQVAGVIQLEGQRGRRMYVHMAKASLHLMRALRPSSPQAFAAAAPEGKGWVLCVSNLTDWMFKNYIGGVVTEDDIGDGGDALAARVLFDQLMPVLSYVASVAEGRGLHPSPESADWSSASSAASGGLHGTSSASGGRDAPSATAQPRLSAGSQAATSTLGFPADIALLLLASAAQLVTAGIGLAAAEDFACAMMCRGNWDDLLSYDPDLLDFDSAEGSDGGGSASTSSDGASSAAKTAGSGNDLEVSLDAVLALAHALVSKGAWWQEAKEQHPVLLVEALYKTVEALSKLVKLTANNICSSVARDASVTRDQDLEAVWSHVTGCPQMHTGAAQHSTHNSMAPSTGSSHASAAPPASPGHAQSPQRPHISQLIIRLILAMLEVLAGPAATKGFIAAWLPTINELLVSSVEAFIAMWQDVDEPITRLLDQATKTPSPDSHPQLAKQAVQLVSLTPQVLREELGVSALNSVYGIAMLQKLVRPEVPLRAVCLLAAAGCLTAEQKGSMVAMLGGTPQNSSSTSPVAHPPLPEPFSLAALRQEDGISLAEMCIALLWQDTYTGPATLEPFAAGASRLVHAFGADQLPAVNLAMSGAGDLASFLAQRAQGGRSTPPPGQGAVLREVLLKKLEQGPLRHAYLNWVHASLLKVIKDVLSQPVPAGL